MVSSTLNAGAQAALLAFILAVMLPGTRSDLPARLGGWGLAVLVAVPVAVLIWPPDDRDLVRSRAAALLRALAGMLHVAPPPAGSRDRLVVMREAARELRAAFRTSIVNNACADAPGGWSEPGLRLRSVAAQLLDDCATTLDHSGDRPAEQACLALDRALQRSTRRAAA